MPNIQRCILLRLSPKFVYFRSKMSPKRDRQSCIRKEETPDDTLIREFERVWLHNVQAGASEKNISDEFLKHIRSKETELQHLLRLPGWNQGDSSFWKSKCFWCLVFPISVTLLLSGALYFISTAYEIDPYDLYYDTVHGTECLVENNQLISEISRPIFACSACEGLDDVPVVNDITEADFVKRFAYTGVPALVKGATTEWNALNTFSYQYFQELYNRHADSFQVTEQSCQFFPYNTEFDSLEAAFNMSNARATYSPGEKPWYFGWSNCHSEIQKELRQQYSRPKFLPKDSESSSLDWIFMGGPGPGAHIHLDSVQRPSWQAQITGSKTWFLIPPPECEHVCKSISVTMNKGDIVIVDTNQWYHSTYIHPGELSITIGSEYD